MWDSLPASTVQADYDSVKGRLKEAFGGEHYLDRFRANLSARPHAKHESLVVYAAEISRLVSEAFPDYGKNATSEEKFCRSLAGLDPDLRLKCHEQGATDMDEALLVAEQCENARGARGIRSESDDGGLHEAVHSLTEELRDMRLDMKKMAEENRRLRSRSSTDGWHSSPSPGRVACHCTCGGHGCRSLASPGLQCGRSPDRRFPSPGRDWRPFAVSRAQSPDSVWSPDVVARTPAALSAGPLNDTHSSDPVKADYVGSTACEVPVSYVKGVIEGAVVPVLLHSGSSVSLISAEFRMSVPALLFSRIKAAGLKLNPSKCHLACNHVVFLGHIISQHGSSQILRIQRKSGNGLPLSLHQRSGRLWAYAHITGALSTILPDMLPLLIILWGKM